MTVSCRLLGYPANQISILTTYNGQKALLQDVIERRCANNPAFGRPHKVRRRPRLSSHRQLCDQPALPHIPLLVSLLLALR